MELKKKELRNIIPEKIKINLDVDNLPAYLSIIGLTIILVAILGLLITGLIFCGIGILGWLMNEWNKGT